VVYDRDLYHYDINSQRVCHTARLVLMKEGEAFVLLRGMMMVSCASVSWLILGLPSVCYGRLAGTSCTVPSLAYRTVVGADAFLILWR
jgi:hypothetical protein